jgi:hypothetical protein
MKQTVIIGKSNPHGRFGDAKFGKRIIKRTDQRTNLKKNKTKYPWRSK